MNIREILRELRNQGFSDADISNKTDSIGMKVTTQQVWSLRKGKTQRPNPSTARAIADAFDLELRYANNEPNFYPRDVVARGGTATSDESSELALSFGPQYAHPIPVLKEELVLPDGFDTTLIGDLPHLYLEALQELRNSLKKNHTETDLENPHWLLPGMILTDHQTYAITVRGDEMDPVYPDGTICVASPSKEVSSKDYVVVKYNDEVIVRRVYFQSDNLVLLKAMNQNYEDIVCPRSSITFMHKITWDRKT